MGSGTISIHAEQRRHFNIIVKSLARFTRITPLKVKKSFKRLLGIEVKNTW